MYSTAPIIVPSALGVCWKLSSASFPLSYHFLNRCTHLAQKTGPKGWYHSQTAFLSWTLAPQFLISLVVFWCLVQPIWFHTAGYFKGPCFGRTFGDVNYSNYIKGRSSSRLSWWSLFTISFWHCTNMTILT